MLKARSGHHIITVCFLLDSIFKLDLLSINLAETRFLGADKKIASLGRYLLVKIHNCPLTMTLQALLKLPLNGLKSFLKKQTYFHARYVPNSLCIAGQVELFQTWL